MADSLRGALIHGGSFGKEAVRYEQLIDRLAPWASADGEESEVVVWTRATLDRLETARDAAATRDADPTGHRPLTRWSAVGTETSARVRASGRQVQ